MMGFGFGGLGLLFMLVFLVAVIGLAVWLLGSLFPRVTSTSSSPPGGRNSNRPDSAQEILKQRYARGENSRAEDEEVLRALQG